MEFVTINIKHVSWLKRTKDKLKTCFDLLFIFSIVRHFPCLGNNVSLRNVSFHFCASFPVNSVKVFNSKCLAIVPDVFQLFCATKCPATRAPVNDCNVTGWQVFFLFQAVNLAAANMYGHDFKIIQGTPSFIFLSQILDKMGSGVEKHPH